MAVYTKINKKQLEAFLEYYELGKLINYEEIREGVENSNYKIIMSTGFYILTIFEKRVDKKDLPFFIKLQKHLVEKKFICPKPISNKKGNYINQIKNKACVINTFLKGKKVDFITERHCQQLGKQLALFHINTFNFKLSRQNSLSQKHWINLFENLRNTKDTKYQKLFDIINLEINFLEKNWPKDLPSGIIHADVFQDNVFFNNNIFSGIIDFYFACNDYYAYELAICINAWCFNSNNELDSKKSNSILRAYQIHRKLLEIEKKALPVLARGAAMRFLLTRLNDHIYKQEKAFVKHKDPMEYLHILHFHQKNNLLKKIDL